jgi:hypothetical protein
MTSCFTRSCARLGIVVGLTAPACAAKGPDDVRRRAWPVVYGDDGRIEAFELADGYLKRLAQRNSVAIVTPDHVAIDSGEVTIDAPTLAETEQICPSERFGEQPAAADCSGILLDARTVLTADHCVRALGCDRMQFLRGYYYTDAGQLHPLHPDDVYGCNRVIVQALSATSAAERFDYAVLELDRPVDEPLEGIAFRPSDEPLSAGESVTLLGFPGGVPLKIAQGGVITDARPTTQDYFISDVDAFHGNSGGPVFDGAARLIGIEGRGNDDYVAGAGCASVARLADDPTSALEQATYASRARAALCEIRPDATSCCRPGDRCVARVETAQPSCRASAVGPSRRQYLRWVALAAACTVLCRARRQRRQSSGAPS